MSMRIFNSITGPLALLALLLALSVTVGDGLGGAAAPAVVLGLAAAKVAIVVSEYVEVRHSARWLIAAWVAWGTATFVGLAVVVSI